MWIARHYVGNTKVFETLTAHPMDGSQIEIAVRMPLVEERCKHIMALKKREDGEYETLAEGDAKYSGYSIRDIEGLRGIATNGH